MTSEPIPDLLADLRAGRYPYGFVAALVGTEDGDRSDKRRRVLDQVLSERDAVDAGAILTNVVLIGARHMLDRAAALDIDDRLAVLDKLGRLTTKGLDVYTSATDALFDARMVLSEREGLLSPQGDQSTRVKGETRSY